MKTLAIALILTASVFAGNCAIGPVGGVLFQRTKFPGEINPAQDVKADYYTHIRAHETVLYHVCRPLFVK